MPIDFACPHCGHRTSVADQYAGQTGPCGACGQTITIPQAIASMAPIPQVVKQPKSGGMIAALVVAGILGVCCFLAVPVALLLPAVQGAREAARRAQCSNNLKQVGLAILNYESTHRCLPPAYLADKQGQPMHSWRVLILPYLDDPIAQSVYDRYDFDQPRDAPANFALADEIPAVFRCPSSAGTAQFVNASNYAVITGPNYVFHQDRALRISDITDGMSNTLLVVETNGLNSPWTAPVDIDAASKSDIINDPGQLGISSDHPGGANVLFTDGSSHYLSDDINPFVLEALLTPAGGENVNHPY